MTTILTQDTTYYFVGIKGSGMSALALILDGEGYQVAGSDVSKYFFTQQELERRGIQIDEFNVNNITEGQTIIAGNAFPDSHPELVKARELELPIYRYHHFLGELIKGYTSIAVTGSHGKTSTTGLLAHTLQALAPTSYLIGDGTGVGDEQADYFAMEACEYRRHFLAYDPDYSIITNVDYDHPDYFTSIEDVVDAFTTFGAQAKKAVIACGEDPYLRNLELKTPVYLYGFDEKFDAYANNIVRTSDGSSFDVYLQNKYFGHFYVPAFGEHNILNTLSVIQLLALEGFKSQDIAEKLATFPGVKRRFSARQIGDLTIIDDYAHHPSEIKATIDAAKQRYPGKRIVAIFQPHTFSRTIALLDQFGQSLSLADDVYLADIFFSAREKDGRVSIADLAKRVDKPVEIVSSEHLSPLMNYTDEVLLFMGAGDIDDLSHHFEQEYAQLNMNSM